MTDTPTIIQFTDPMCTWCWGSEPIMRHLRTAFGDQIRFEYVMGGLIADFDDFYDAANDIADPGDVGPHWVEASEAHGMPIDTDIFDVDPAHSTYPASEAFVAARRQDRELGHRYLRQLREAFATQVRNVNHREEQVAIAESIGLDVDSFTTALDSGDAWAAFEGDLERTREAGVKAFPTYQVRGPEGTHQVGGFQSFADLSEKLSAVAPSVERASPPSIHTFVTNYGPVATQEVAEVCELQFGKAQQALQSLAADGTVRRERRGNGHFWDATAGGDA